MGHSTASMTQRFREERALFSGYERALLLKSDKLLFDEMWDAIEAYIPPAEKSSHPFLIATVLMSMLLEQRKLIEALQSAVERLEHEAAAGQETQKAETARLAKELHRLDDDLETRLRDLREEVTGMLYPDDTAS